MKQMQTTPKNSGKVRWLNFKRVSIIFSKLILIQNTIKNLEFFLIYFFYNKTTKLQNLNYFILLIIKLQHYKSQKLLQSNISKINLSIQSDTPMNFLKNFTKSQIFQKVAQIANIQIKQKIKQKAQQTKIFFRDKIESSKNKLQSSQKQQQVGQQYKQKVQEQSCNNLAYEQCQRFILQLSSNSKSIKKKEQQKKSKKQIFNQLEVQPIYLQSCNPIDLFKMEIQLGQMGKYERTQILHNYLSQINQTLKKILFSQNLIILDTFSIINQSSAKLNRILDKIKSERQTIKKLKSQKALKIAQLMKSKLIIKEKLAMLQKMKQKQQITITKPQNLEQIYYSQRNRHKLYLKIKNMKNIQKSQNYFQILKDQIIQISLTNVKILEQSMVKWANSTQQMNEKNIQKLLICLYFIKMQAVYKDNTISINFNQTIGLDKLSKGQLIEKIEKVKLWKNYKYIRDPMMKQKIIQFLNDLIQEIKKTIY